MLNPYNFKSIEYDLKNQVMTIHLKEYESINGFNKKNVNVKCDYEKYSEYVKKWIDITKIS